mmetsp:Transcript_13220/g.42377  ORF Transcript_13220/g.42377 Transcript_13220/m.42377 type:complete len:313 (+) Transcript_13220:351-1289(+)
MGSGGKRSHSLPLYGTPSPPSPPCPPACSAPPWPALLATYSWSCPPPPPSREPALCCRCSLGTYKGKDQTAPSTLSQPQPYLRCCTRSIPTTAWLPSTASSAPATPQPSPPWPPPVLPPPQLSCTTHPAVTPPPFAPPRPFPPPIRPYGRHPSPQATDLFLRLCPHQSAQPHTRQTAWQQQIWQPPSFLPPAFTARRPVFTARQPAFTARRPVFTARRLVTSTHPRPRRPTACPVAPSPGRQTNPSLSPHTPSQHAPRTRLIPTHSARARRPPSPHRPTHRSRPQTGLTTRSRWAIMEREPKRSRHCGKQDG